MNYIHQLSEWPDFTWDAEAVSLPLAAVRHKQGRHLGKLESLGFNLRIEAGLTSLTHDVVQTSAIEGEKLDSAEVRSSIARKLGVDAAGLPEPGRQVEGVVDMMLDATRNFAQPLTTSRLFDWHAALFPTGRSGMYPITVGAWRGGKAGPMQVVSGPIGKERVHFQAPRSERLDDEMAKFLAWFNTAELDPVLKAAIAHLWFVTIHPFDDGNGRIARAIADMALCRADLSKERFYSMSTAIAQERRVYYLQLESVQRGSLDVTSWLTWFLACLDRALDAADTMLEAVLYKARLWQKINAGPVNERQRKVINRMLDDWHGHMNTSKYATLATCSKDTALRDIRELMVRSILIQNKPGGRSTSYRLPSPDEL
jgi:Fic family protein